MAGVAPPWYGEGLRFTCTECGDCCTGQPGAVWVDDDEVARLAEHLALPVEDFERRYVRSLQGRRSLVERPGGDCVFYDRTLRGDRGGCSVYDARPVQCRTWPFWRANLASPRAWQETCAECSGSGQGRHHDLVEIRRLLQLRRS